MKHEKWIEAVMKSARRERGLYLPPGERTRRSWPLCMTCNREVEAVELKNVNSTSCELWARCHGGQEDYYKVIFPFRLEGDPLENEDANFAVASAMKAAVMFDPTKPSK